ncbi:PDC sensor domain-containing protein [Roseivivax isoporae]|uniref:Chemotaxis protein n=1 Tax=Roseivivax isoporae LMG 25204 TaxID=1449351 RepID=X7FCJ1_9RHOB|nr:PDC sensor domain-containing protein [Roseivivax isoporae]ETX30607.1 hypothetical protein RISW2_07260 [Roseivivax isoporae LMG 25204]
MHGKITLTALGLTAALATAGWASGDTAAMTSYVQEQVAAWASDPELVAAVQASNVRHAGMAEADLLALDVAWRAEVGAATAPTIGAVADSAASGILRAAVAASGGRITEIILMDDHGMNAAISAVTSDFWQGDEPKFQETFPTGAVHASEVEFDESTQIYQVQISMPFTTADGVAIGAVTVGVDVDAF